VPVQAAILLPSEWTEKAEVIVTGSDGTAIHGQLAPPALLDRVEPAPAGMSWQVLWWVLPRIPANKNMEWDVTISERTKPVAEAFAWQDTAGRHLDLQFAQRPVLRYMYQAYENDPAKRDQNNKPFHHLFDPAGTRLVTKPSGGFETHHQGLFYGFTSCTFEGGKCNIWYCHDGEHQLHTKHVSQVSGPVLARHQAEIDWNDRDGKSFCREHRELTAFALGGGTLVEFASQVRSVRGDVTLEGDPHHAGFHFRADDEVSKRRKEVYFLRPDGKGEPGQEKNDASRQNLPWNAMSFMLGETRYTVVYIDNPRNPKPSRYSERLYGRFGSAVGKHVLREDGPPLELNYRIWLQNGEMTVEQANAVAAAFSDPAKCVVMPKK
jgi:hypothetical protein